MLFECLDGTIGQQSRGHWRCADGVLLKAIDLETTTTTTTSWCHANPMQIMDHSNSPLAQPEPPTDLRCVANASEKFRALINGRWKTKESNRTNWKTNWKTIGQIGFLNWAQLDSTGSSRRFPTCGRDSFQFTVRRCWAVNIVRFCLAVTISFDFIV